MSGRGRCSSDRWAAPLCPVPSPPRPDPAPGPLLPPFLPSAGAAPRAGVSAAFLLAFGALAEHALPEGSEHSQVLTWGGVRGGALRGAHAPPRHLPAPRAMDGGGVRRE